jgi:hypothetical protein
MKLLLLPLLFVAGHAFACPGDKSKDAMAPATTKPVVAATSPAPAATDTSTKAVTKVVSTKTSTTAEPRKASSL